MTALFVSLTATAVGLPGKNKIDKNDLKANVVKSKHVAANAVGGGDVNEGSLGTVPSASNATELAGLPLADIKGAAGSFDSDCDPTVVSTFENCTSGTIVLPQSADLYVSYTAEWHSDDSGNVRGFCRIERDDNVQQTASLELGSTDDDTDNDQQRSFAMNQIFEDVPAGTHTFRLECTEEAQDMDYQQVRGHAFWAVPGA
jgi:hypothetical protein